MGLHQYSPENAQKLLDLLAGRPALLLTWKHGGGWGQADLALAAQQRVVFLAAPYGRADAKAALLALDAPVEPKRVAAPISPDAQPRALQEARAALGAPTLLPAPALSALLPALGLPQCFLLLI